MTELIKTKYQQDVATLFSESLELFESLPWENSLFYNSWLAQTYFMVSHTPRFICLAAARFGVDRDLLHRKMVDHFSDEDGHEYLLLKNLNSQGCDIANHVETPEASLMVQQLYYAIDNIDPVAIYGRIFYLEYLASKLSDSFKSRFKSIYSEEQGSFLRVHFEEDIKHVESAYQNIERLSEKEQKIVGDSFCLSAILYSQCMRGLMKASSQASNIKKAA